MTGYVTILDLANRLAIDRSYLHKKVKRDRVGTISMLVMTNGGPQRMTCVPRDYADSLIRDYREAEANARELRRTGS